MRLSQLIEDTRKLVNGSDRGRFNEIILAVAIFSKFVRGSKDIDANYVKSALKLLAKSNMIELSSFPLDKLLDFANSVFVFLANSCISFTLRVNP